MRGVGVALLLTIALTGSVLLGEQVVGVQSDLVQMEVVHPRTGAVMVLEFERGKTSWGFQQEPPTTYEHPREKPKVACYPLTKDRKPGCGCLKDPEHGESGCSSGSRVIESRMCSSHCWPEMCACCRS